MFSFQIILIFDMLHVRTRTQMLVATKRLSTVFHHVQLLSAVLSATTIHVHDVNNGMHLLFIILTSIVHASLHSGESVALVMNNV